MELQNRKTKKKKIKKVNTKNKFDNSIFFVWDEYKKRFLSFNFFSRVKKKKQKKRN